MKIGIAGFGFVGQAVYGSLRRPSEAVIYDPPKGYDTWDRLLETEVLFSCLPTPMIARGDQQDWAIYHDFLNAMHRDYDGLLIIKSTCLWENIRPWVSLGAPPIVINPEFLKANSAREDFHNQRHIIIGGDADNAGKLIQCYKTDFELQYPPTFHVVQPKVACDFKYFHNVLQAYMSLAGEWAHDVLDNQRQLVKLFAEMHGVPESFLHMAVGMDGYRGYGGACFPKDVGAIHNARPHVLTEFMRRYNGQLLDATFASHDNVGGLVDE